MPLLSAAYVAVFWAVGVAVVSAVGIRRGMGAPGAVGSAVGGTVRGGERGGLAARASTADILLIRPCAGPEPHLARTLASSRVVAALTPAARVVFAVASVADAAWPVADRVAAALRAEGIDASVQVTSPDSPNAKSAQLAAVVAAHGSTVVVSADSDVELAAGDLHALLACLDDGADAAWAPPVEVAPRTLADRASQAVLGGSLHAFTLLAGLDGGGFVGKLFGVRREALARAGGFEAAANALGEDVELGRRLRAIGARVVAVARPVRSLAQGRDGAAVVERYARWIQVVRARRAPLLLAYPAIFLATPLVLALALLGAAADPLAAIVAATVALTARVAVARAARRHAGHATGLSSCLLDAVLAESLLLLAFARALTRRHVCWRGRRIQLGRESIEAKVGESAI